MMSYAIQWIRSFVFLIQMYAMMPILALFFTPMTLVNRQWAYRGCRTYCRWVRWTARWMVGLKSEIRGPVPTQECLIASKHQSFFDILLIVSVVPHPKFIMKASLRYAPILGWYSKQIGCVHIDRGKKRKTVQQMIDGVRDNRDKPGQLIIYPQGTRVAPGSDLPYKVGPAILYKELEQDCVPAATNVGVFWPRIGIFRKPGLAVVEFLPAISPGMEQGAFMQKLEHDVESASNQLMAEAGFKA